MSLLKTLFLGDFRNIQRDALLAWFLFIPIVTALLIRIAVPELTAWLWAEYAFDLRPYSEAFLGYFLILMAPQMVGTIIGFLLLDERDDQTLVALQVTPLSLKGYLSYRLGAPMVLSVLLAWAVFPIAGITPLPFAGQLLVVLLAALEAPLYTLCLASFAENKVTGLALMKGMSALLILPLAAYFIPAPWQDLAGLIPTYWPLKLFWLISAGQPYGGYFLIGLAFHLILLAALVKRFERVLHQ